MRRDELLADFRVIAAAHFGRAPDESLDALLAKFAIEIPDEALEPKTPIIARNDVYLLGMIDDEVADECIDDLMQVHLNRPLAQPLQLILSSEGGEVSAGMAICSTISQIRRDGRGVRAHVAGVAFSAAFDILQMCDHRSAEPTAFLLLHEEQFGTEGSTSTVLRDAKYSRRQVAAMLRVLSRRTGKSVDFYQRKIDSKNWYLGADEALAEHFIDEIVEIPAFRPPPEAPAPRARRRRPENSSS